MRCSPVPHTASFLMQACARGARFYLNPPQRLPSAGHTSLALAACCVLRAQGPRAARTHTPRRCAHFPHTPARGRYAFEALVSTEFHGATDFRFTAFHQPGAPSDKLPHVDVTGARRGRRACMHACMRACMASAAARALRPASVGGFTCGDETSTGTCGCAPGDDLASTPPHRPATPNTEPAAPAAPAPPILFHPIPTHTCSRAHAGDEILETFGFTTSDSAYWDDVAALAALCCTLLGTTYLLLKYRGRT